MKFTRIPETAFQKLQLNAGILLSNFNPETGEVQESDLLGATSGGVNFKATPSFSDFGEDIDNAPVNVKELKRQDNWVITMSGNFVTVDGSLARRMIGAADIDDENAAKVVPRSDLKDSDFMDLWWVGDYSDENGAANGGYLAIRMMNSLSTGGFSVQSTNRGKGQFAFEFTAHYSLANQNVVPFEVYVKAGGAEG